MLMVYVVNVGIRRILNKIKHSLIKASKYPTQAKRFYTKVLMMRGTIMIGIRIWDKNDLKHNNPGKIQTVLQK